MHDILVAVKSRVLIAAVAATLAAGALAGCRTNLGTAASISGHRISDSAVGTWLRPEGPSSAAVAAAKAQGQTLGSPRSQVLQYLIMQQVLQQTLDKEAGGVPSDGVLASYHDQATSLLLQTNLAGSELDRRLGAGLQSSGISPGFSKVFLRVEEMEYLLIARKKLTQLPQLTALIRKAGVSVQVSPRYGKWNASQLVLDGKVATPSYLTVQPSAATG